VQFDPRQGAAFGKNVSRFCYVSWLLLCLFYCQPSVLEMENITAHPWIMVGCQYVDGYWFGMGLSSETRKQAYFTSNIF